MAYIQPNYKIAAGHNNSGGLAAFSSLVTTGDAGEYDDAPHSFAKWRNGVRMKMPNGTDYWRGKPSATWIVSRCTSLRFIYLRDTILLGAYSGPVTVQTLKGGVGSTFAIYNGTLELPELTDLDNPPGTTIFLDFDALLKMLIYLADAS